MTRDDQIALAKWLLATGQEMKRVADAMPKSRDNTAARAAAQGRASGVLFIVQDVLSDEFPLVRRK